MKRKILSQGTNLEFIDFCYNLVLHRSERSPKEIIKEMKQNKMKAKKSEKPENAKKDDTFEK